MNRSRQMEFHDIDTDFPYTVTESFMDFFEGFTHVPVDFVVSGSMPDQEGVYWSMNMNPYKFVMSGPGSTAYCSPYDVNSDITRMEVTRGEWEYSSSLTGESTTAYSLPARESTSSMHAVSEECSPDHHDSSNPQVVWQDNVDPDNMTYEELLDLGDAVGTQSRGLPQELIDLLPTSKCKFGNIFRPRNYGKRCVICQMTYRRGDQQIKLPCGHVYHAECISKWLSINKKCPVCNVEVFGEEPKH